jgi:hypothetical protein
LRSSTSVALLPAPEKIEESDRSCNDDDAAEED